MGGEIAEREKGAATRLLNLPLAFDPPRQEWSIMPSHDTPASRTSCSTIWTGKEMIIWGGWPVPHTKPLTDGYAYDLASGRWRKLPEVPRFRPGDARR